LENIFLQFAQHLPKARYEISFVTLLAKIVKVRRLKMRFPICELEVLLMLPLTAKYARGILQPALKLDPDIRAKICT
jgi:hypothetical protein